MNLVANYFRELGRETVRGWNYFWFNPTDPATLCLIRILAGTMLLYTHAVWTLGLNDFFGPHSWISPQAAATFHREGYAWSFFWWIESPTLLWTVHLVGLAIFAMFALGLYSRVVAVLSYLLTVAYVNRVPGALFGLDQINALLAMYLMIGPSGARYSLDRWLARRRAGGQLPEVAPSISANISIRLIQLHMCVIYFFAGISKLMGPSWWEGTALWGAFANLEYQSLDMLWLVHYPILINILTQVSLLWELTYWALVWPRWTRPIVIALAVPLHLGIAICMGMVTFGLVMLFGNMAFISPRLVRLLMERDYRLHEDDNDEDSSAERTRGDRGRAGEAPRTAAKPSHAKRRDQGGARASAGPR